MPSSRILVVDDDSQITRVLRTTLTAQRYDVRVANDGETALEIIKDWSPDLVLTDVSMPNMDGLALSAPGGGLRFARHSPHRTGRVVGLGREE